MPSECVRRWGKIAGGVALGCALVGCGGKEDTKKKSSDDDDTTAAPMSSEERVRARLDDARRLCGKLKDAGLKEQIEPRSFEVDMDFSEDPAEQKNDNCEKMFVVLLRDAPATFWKVSSCLHDDHKARGCVSEIRHGDETFKKALETLKVEVKQEKIAKFAEITQIKTAPFEAKLRSYGDADRSVSVDLPSNLTDGEDKTLPAFLRWKDSPGAKDGPTVTLMSRYSMPSMDEQVKQVSGSEKVVKQESRPDGFTVITESSYSMEVTIVKRISSSDYGQQAVECQARLSGDKAIAAKEKLLPWLEKLCTMTVK